MRRKKSKPQITNQAENSLFPGYPVYPASEDIFNKGIEMQEIDPEDTTKMKSSTEDEVGTTNEKHFEDDETGGDLDVPGAELDDAMEAIGSEDEENNYYSLGGDGHTDLEEDKGD